MIHLPATRARTIQAIIVTAAIVAVSFAGPAWSIASAQTSTALVLDSQLPQTLLPASVGHRQPRRADLPSAVQRDENMNAASERQFDQQLQICRGCRHRPSRMRSLAENLLRPQVLSGCYWRERR
jgi:hypothetical protein